jgi:Transglycosylase SLT domain
MFTQTEQLIGVVILFLFGSKKANASGKSNPDDDGADLVKRANQKAALDWVPLFEKEGAPEDYADAAARWVGLESSGNPRAVSSAGERGLTQLGPATQKEGALTDTEWSALLATTTTNQQHAHMALRVIDWLWLRADKYVPKSDTIDPATEPQDAVWYAYLYQQRPVDVRDGKLHGRAISMARELAQTWSGDAAKMHRLRAANVVAFGVPNP